MARLTSLTAALFFLANLPVWSQSVRQEASGRISIAADKASLTDLCRELSERGLIEAAVLEPRIKDTPVTLNARELTPGQAVVAVLEAAGVAFTLQGAPGRPFRVLAEPAGDSRDGSRGLQLPSPSRPGEAPDPSLYEPARRREITGDATPATGAAASNGRPQAGAVGWTVLVLGAGLLLGIPLRNGFTPKPRTGGRPPDDLVDKPSSS